MKKKTYWLRICGPFPARDEGSFASLSKASEAAKKASLVAGVSFVHLMTRDAFGPCSLETARRGEINTYPGSQF